MTELLVQARGVQKEYASGAGVTSALRDINCEIKPGERVAIVGPSGSGKTTLIHLLGGLDVPTSGTITWPALGSKSSLRPKSVSLIFQVPTLLPALTVIENVELPLLLERTDPAVARTRARAVLEALSLSPLANALPEELSGGQAQRVAAARALVTQPQLLLADEPTGQLDSESAQAFMDAVLAALSDSKAALVLATHDASLACRLQDIWHMRHGELTC